MNRQTWYRELDRICLFQEGCTHIKLDESWRWFEDYCDGKSPNQSYMYWRDVRGFTRSIT